MKRRLKSLKPAQILALGFLAVILLGAFLLTLPISVKPGQPPLDFLDALFTATSSVCVTGLVVVNTGLYFSLFGKIVILCLIQIGGLGFMTVTALFFMLLGKNFSLSERIVIQESFSVDTLKGMGKLVLNALRVTFIIESAGAAVLLFRLIPEYGIATGIFYSIFMAVSAFCNAGFDPFGFEVSIVPYATDPLINWVIIALIALGGLGFAVISDVVRKRSWQKLTLHSRLVISVTLALLLSGTALTLLTEYTNPLTLDNPAWSFGDKIMVSAFQSTTLRTAGFDTLGQNNLTPAGQLVGMILMFIGASPASTGGGIKTTTFIITAIAVTATIRQKDDYNLCRKRLNVQTVKKAQTIVFLALTLVLTDVLLIVFIQNASGNAMPLPDILYEVISAGATVGLSTGITPALHPLSKLIIIITMFMGRVGPLTVSIALSRSAVKSNAIRYPEDRVMIG